MWWWSLGEKNSTPPITMSDVSMLTPPIIRFFGGWTSSTLLTFYIDFHWIMSAVTAATTCDICSVVVEYVFSWRVYLNLCEERHAPWCQYVNNGDVKVSPSVSLSTLALTNPPPGSRITLTTQVCRKAALILVHWVLQVSVRKMYGLQEWLRVLPRWWTFLLQSLRKRR